MLNNCMNTKLVIQIVNSLIYKDLILKYAYLVTENRCS